MSDQQTTAAVQDGVGPKNDSRSDDVPPKNPSSRGAEVPSKRKETGSSPTRG